MPSVKWASKIKWSENNSSWCFKRNLAIKMKLWNQDYKNAYDQANLEIKCAYDVAKKNELVRSKS